MVMRRLAPALFIVFGLTLSNEANATYSIVAVDQSTNQVGGAGTSCVGRLDVHVIYGSVESVGVVHAQARLNQQGRNRAVQRLMEGRTAQEILDEITAPSFDRLAAQRQYGIATLNDGTAAFTGNGTGDHASHRTGMVDSFTYATQGNILTSRAVIDQTSDAFEASGCDLADRLMLALEAGALNGEGDSRCTPNGIPSDSAFIEVDRPGEAEGSWLLLRVVDTAPANPVTLLRAEYDQWRAQNPCPEPRDGGVPDTGAPDTGVRDGGDVDPRDGGDVSSPDGAVLRDSGADVPGDAGSPITAKPNVDSDDGCGCTTGGRAAGPSGLLLLLVAQRLRRRRRRGRSSATC